MYEQFHPFCHSVSVEQYIYIQEEVTYYMANKLCQDHGYLHLAVMDTIERQRMFIIAMEIEYKWVLAGNELHNFIYTFDVWTG